MYEVNEFLNELFGSLTVLTDENKEIWFIGNQATNILGYKNFSDALLKHTNENDRKALNYKDYRETRLSNLWGKNDFRPKTIINESGLYCLIFGSELDSAQAFKSWVTHDVLPSIRKHGGYIMDQESLSKEDQEQLFRQIESLQQRVKKITEKERFLQKRRHELIADKKKLQERKKHLLKEVDALNDCLDLYETMLETEQEESERLRMELLTAAITTPKVKATKTPTVTEEIRPMSIIRVDAEGFLI